MNSACRIASATMVSVGLAAAPVVICPFCGGRVSLSRPQGAPEDCEVFDVVPGCKHIVGKACALKSEKYRAEGMASTVCPTCDGTEQRYLAAEPMMWEPAGESGRSGLEERSCADDERRGRKEEKEQEGSVMLCCTCLVPRALLQALQRLAMCGGCC